MGEKKNEVKEPEDSQEELEKALAIALEKIEKAKKVDLPPVEEEDEDEEDEEEILPTKKSEEPDFEALSKSLEESVAEKDEDASEVLDGIPFVKALTETLEDQVVELVKAIVYLSEKVEGIEEKVEKSQAVTMSEAKLIKSVSENLRKIGETPFPRKAKINNLEIMRKSATGEEEKTVLSKAEALTKLTQLHREGKISLVDSITSEGRIQKGIELPENIRNLLITN